MAFLQNNLIIMLSLLALSVLSEEITYKSETILLALGLVNF
jgi:hypothetical protein